MADDPATDVKILELRNCINNAREIAVARAQMTGEDPVVLALELELAVRRDFKDGGSERAMEFLRIGAMIVTGASRHRGHTTREHDTMTPCCFGS